MTLENRYIVLKMSDVRHLDKKAQDQLSRLVAAHDFVRELRGAEPIQAVVVEHDWPEYEDTVESIERRSNGLSRMRPTEWLYAFAGGGLFAFCVYAAARSVFW